MRIAQVIATFPPYHGGMGYVCYHNSLELAQRGHEVTIFTLDHDRLIYNEDPGNFKIVRLRTPLKYGDGGMVPQLTWYLKNFDVVHVHYPFFGGAEYVYLAAVLRRIRYFLTYHMDVWGNTFLKKILLGVYEPFLSKRIIQRAEVIGALSLEHLQSSKVSRFIDWTKVIELPNGVDTNLFRPRAKDQLLVKQYGLRDKTVILFVGNLQPFKGLHLLINAIAQIKKQNIVLLVIGGSYGEEKYRAQVRELNLEEHVIFTGPQSPKEFLPAYYNLGDFLVLPSTHSEAFPLVVLEAMASGIPVIVSDLPGPSSMIDQGRNGLIVRTGDPLDLVYSIEMLVKDVDMRRKMGATARDKVLGSYRWEKIGDCLEAIFKKIHETHPRSNSENII